MVARLRAQATPVHGGRRRRSEQPGWFPRAARAIRPPSRPFDQKVVGRSTSRLFCTGLLLNQLRPGASANTFGQPPPQPAGTQLPPLATTSPGCVVPACPPRWESSRVAARSRRGRRPLVWVAKEEARSLSVCVVSRKRTLSFTTQLPRKLARSPKVGIVTSSLPPPQWRWPDVRVVTE
ncbi:hypothetical protein MRX96_047205 [Rhipicephalus microplus]